MRYARFMKRTTVMLPDDLLARVRHEAKRRGTSVADVVRGAVEREVAEPSGGRELAFFGVGASDHADTSERADELLGEILDERLRDDADR